MESKYDLRLGSRDGRFRRVERLQITYLLRLEWPVVGHIEVSKV
jgi:hypothetical protein